MKFREIVAWPDEPLIGPDEELEWDVWDRDWEKLQDEIEQGFKELEELFGV